MAWAIGETVTAAGNVTRLSCIRPGEDSYTESMIGYAQGRLSKGYFILLLLEALRPGEFQFHGTTLRSGGKLGLPCATPEAEDRRRKVHDLMIREYGEAHYRKMQDSALRNAPLRGADRIAKIAPAIRHDDSLSAAEQYPMGGGGLQWDISRDHPKSFYIGAEVLPGGIARTPEGVHQLGLAHAADRYEQRRALRQYLMRAPDRA